jgi:hypothetical protein
MSDGAAMKLRLLGFGPTRLPPSSQERAIILEASPQLPFLVTGILFGPTKNLDNIWIHDVRFDWPSKKKGDKTVWWSMPMSNCPLPAKSILELGDLVEFPEEPLMPGDTVRVVVMNCGLEEALFGGLLYGPVT